MNKYKENHFSFFFLNNNKEMQSIKGEYICRH